MLYFNASVDPQGMRPELGLVFAALAPLAATSDIGVSCIVNGEHSHASLHYSGSAVDVDTLSDQLTNRVIADHLRLALPSWCYDVVDEGTHVHIEYQPKRPHRSN